MIKSIFSLLAVALVCAAAVSARADQGIASSTLDAMGLSDLVVMSDSEALAVRGLGYSNNNHDDNGSRHDKKKSKGPSAKASGKSWAEVEFEGEKIDVEAEAGTENAYSAQGKYEASGDNFSEAGLTKSTSTRVDYSDGTHSIETKTFSIEVSAGGWSSAKAF